MLVKSRVLEHVEFLEITIINTKHNDPVIVLIFIIPNHIGKSSVISILYVKQPKTVFRQGRTLFDQGCPNFDKNFWGASVHEKIEI